MSIGLFCRRKNLYRHEHGYILLVFMIMVTFIAIAAAMQAPAIATQIKRDREEELVHRGAQYARAIKNYYKRFQRYPASIDQLMNTNNIRFLRQRYKDPITGKDFKLLHVGEVTLTAKGVGNLTGPGVSTSQNQGVNVNGALFSGNTGSTGLNPSTGTAGVLSSDSNQGSSTGTGNTSQPPTSGTSSGTTFGSGTASGGTGQTYGGGPIIGVTSQSDKTSLLEFNDKKHYNEWEFIYDPTMDRGGLIMGPWVPIKLGAGTNSGVTTTNPGSSTSQNPLQQTPSSSQQTPSIFGSRP